MLTVFVRGLMKIYFFAIAFRCCTGTKKPDVVILAARYGYGKTLSENTFNFNMQRAAPLRLSTNSQVTSTVLSVLSRMATAYRL